MDTIIATIPLPGTIGIGAGPVHDGEFNSVVWFPANEKDEADSFVAGTDWVTRENIPL